MADADTKAPLIAHYYGAYGETLTADYLSQMVRNPYAAVLAQREDASAGCKGFTREERKELKKLFALQTSPGMPQAGVWDGYGYNGEAYDERTELSYLRARTLDVETHRFLTADTVKGNVYQPLSQNLYGYVLGNPVRYVDPSGHVAVGEGADPVSYAKCGSKGIWDTIVAIYSEQDGGVAELSGPTAIVPMLPMPGDNIITFPLEALAGLVEKGIVEALTSPVALLAVLAILIYPVYDTLSNPDSPGRPESFPTWEDYRDVLSGPITIPTNTLELWKGLYLSKAEDGESEGSEKTVDDILDESTPGRETKGSSVQYIKEGGYNQALDDFDSLNPSNVRDIPNGKVGTLPDGRTVNVRTESSYKMPTLEIYDGSKSIKIRYK